MSQEYYIFDNGGRGDRTETPQRYSCKIKGLRWWIMMHITDSTTLFASSASTQYYNERLRCYLPFSFSWEHIINFEPDKLNSVGEVVIFCHQAFSQFLVAAISFVIDCQEKKFAQTVQIYQLFQLLNPLCVNKDVFYGLACMLMSKNVNNDAQWICLQASVKLLSLDQNFIMFMNTCTSNGSDITEILKFLHN